MKSTKTAIMTIAITLAVIVGMTGLAMAGSTTATLVGSGDYSADWNGRGGGDISIYTYTPEGYDKMLTSAGSRYDGRQDMYTSGDGWTVIDREVNSYNPAITTTFTQDTSGDYVSTSIDGERRTELDQTVIIVNNGYLGDSVFVFTEMEAGSLGRNNDATMMVKTGTYSDGSLGTFTKIKLVTNKCGELGSIARATTYDIGDARSGQIFTMIAPDRCGKKAIGTGLIQAIGSDEVGFDIHLEYDKGDTFDLTGTEYGDGSFRSVSEYVYTDFDKDYTIDLS